MPLASHAPGAGMGLRGVLVVALVAPLATARAPLVGDGYWHASGHTIVDASGNAVRFSGVNFSGFETENFALHGTWGGTGRNWKSYLDQMSSLGFNVVRLPFSGDLFAPGQLPRNVDYGVNPELQGKTALQFLDMFVEECGRRGIRVILDYHRIQAGSATENGLWYIPGSTKYTERFWIDNWKALVARYVGNPTVVGVDLFNEPHAGPGHLGPTWNADGLDEPYNWRTAAKRAAEAILSVNPGLLVCVQGMDVYRGEAGWFGAVWIGLHDHPFDISRPSQVVYEIHDYGPDVFDEPWHDAPGFPASLKAFWDRQWGFIHANGIGPVWIGEWGSRLDTAKERAWATALRDYIAANGLSWTWWTWGPVSPDTGGVLQDDWKSTWSDKLALMQPVMSPGFGADGDGAQSGGCSSAPVRPHVAAGSRTRNVVPRPGSL
jgi:endoglucanase